MSRRRFDADKRLAMSECAPERARASEPANLMKDVPVGTLITFINGRRAWPISVPTTITPESLEYCGYVGVGFTNGYKPAFGSVP